MSMTNRNAHTHDWDEADGWDLDTACQHYHDAHNTTAELYRPLTLEQIKERYWGKADAVLRDHELLHRLRADGTQRPENAAAENTG